MERDSYRNMMPSGSRTNGGERTMSWYHAYGRNHGGYDGGLGEDISVLITANPRLVSHYPEVYYQRELASSSSQHRSAFHRWQRGFSSASYADTVPNIHTTDTNHLLQRRCFDYFRRVHMAHKGDGAPATEQVYRTTPDEGPTSHVLAERKRRRKQGESMQALQSLVLPVSRKTDKVTVLANTVTYLEKLKTEKDQLLERTRELQSVIHRQEQERKRKQGQEQGGEPQSLGE